MRRHSLVGPVVIVLAVASSSCGGSTPTPTPIPIPTGTSTAFATGLTISGTTSLSAVGETSQLTATANLSDGTTKDVTSQAQWRSADAAIVIISPSGLLTVASLGSTSISVSYQSRGSQVQVVATPPGTFVAYGRTREPGQSDLSGVQVLEPQSGKSTVTPTTPGEAGRYSIPGVTSPRLTFQKDGYESRQADVAPNEFTDVALQRVVRVTAGNAVTPLPLAPHDLVYEVGADHCEPCRLIRVVTPASGMLHLSLTWTEARAVLKLWANGQLFTGTVSGVTADVQAGAGEVIVHVGMTSPGGFSAYVPFSLATSLGP